MAQSQSALQLQVSEGISQTVSEDEVLLFVPGIQIPMRYNTCEGFLSTKWVILQFMINEAASQSQWDHVHGIINARSEDTDYTSDVERVDRHLEFTPAIHVFDGLQDWTLPQVWRLMEGMAASLGRGTAQMRLEMVVQVLQRAFWQKFLSTHNELRAAESQYRAEASQ
jgi:hypothetical protein